MKMKVICADNARTFEKRSNEFLSEMENSEDEFEIIDYLFACTDFYLYGTYIYNLKKKRPHNMGEVC